MTEIAGAGAHSLGADGKPLGDIDAEFAVFEFVSALNTLRAGRSIVHAAQIDGRLAKLSVGYILPAVEPGKHVMAFLLGVKKPVILIAEPKTTMFTQDFQRRMQHNGTSYTIQDSQRGLHLAVSDYIAYLLGGHDTRVSASQGSVADLVAAVDAAQTRAAQGGVTRDGKISLPWSERPVTAADRARHSAAPGKGAGR